ncbi:hypothetical protein RSAG8_04726, partial [Rhizoctonia solani AG-8 WAC10335]
MPLNDDPTSRGRKAYPTPGESVVHPKLGDEVGFREGNRWILYKVYEITRAPEVGYVATDQQNRMLMTALKPQPGCMSALIYP